MATLRQQIATNVLSATRYRDLLNLVRQNRPKDDIEIVKKAYEFSQKHHAGQTRASGEPYLVHPLEVGIILAGWATGMGVTVAVALVLLLVIFAAFTRLTIRMTLGTAPSQAAPTSDRSSPLPMGRWQ